MKKAWDSIARDLWIVLLDIIAVNLSYFLALLIRFYVNFQLRPVAVNDYLPTWLRFTPFYTVIAILVFVLFRLYGGMWRYAGINDMNRIIGANLVTTLIHIIATVILFTKRMPVTYYLIGALLQFFFVVLIRFAYRILMVEKKKIVSRKLPLSNVMIVGTGELGRKVIRELDDNTAFRPACIVEASNDNEGRMMDGIPVVNGTDEIKMAIDQYKIQYLFIADTTLSTDQRQSIHSVCEEKGIEIQDYTGMLSNQDDSISVTALLELTKCPVLIRMGEEEHEFENSRLALFELTDRYGISSITVEDGHLVLDLRQSQQVAFVLNDDQAVAYVGYDAWAKKEASKT